MFALTKDRWFSTVLRLAAVVCLSLGLAGQASAQTVPNNVDDMMRQAQKLLSKGEPKDAIALLRKAIDAAPARAELYMLRSRAYDQTGKYDAAIDDATKYIELQPRDALGYLNRARVYMSMEKHESALRDANTAIELAPQEPDGYYRRSDIYYQLGKDGEAKADEAKADMLDKQAS
jgi:tetratricopeptide (TPR) repeat protein